MDQQKKYGKHTKYAWKIFAVTMVSVVFFGSLFYFWQTAIIKKQAQNNQRELLDIENINMQKSIQAPDTKLQVEQEATTETIVVTPSEKIEQKANIEESTTITIESSDNRILLTPENMDQHNPFPNNCEEKFNLDTADSTIDYIDSEKGISFKLPYNTKWGSSRFKIHPYDKLDNSISFGPMYVFDGCNWIRPNAMEFQPAETIDKVIKNLLSDNLEYKDKKIGDLIVVEYIEPGFCGDPTLVVIGKKYNYKFRIFCGDWNSLGSLEEIVKTIKFTE